MRGRHIFQEIGQGVCLLCVLTGLMVGIFAIRVGKADSTYNITALPFTASRTLSASDGDASHWYTTTFTVAVDAVAPWEYWISASLLVPHTANFDLFIFGTSLEAPVCESINEAGPPGSIYGYDEFCVWYMPTPQTVTVQVVGTSGAGAYQLIVEAGGWFAANKTPPPPPETPLSLTPDVNQGWQKWSFAELYDQFYWNDDVLFSLPNPREHMTYLNAYQIRVTSLNHETGSDGPHQPWNNFAGTGFVSLYGLYKTLEAPPGPYTLQFDVWVYEHASATHDYIDNWLMLLVDTKGETPAVVWHYFEEPSQGHQKWRRLTGRVEIALNSPNLSVLMGVRDHWDAEHNQGVKFHFESLVLDPLKENERDTWHNEDAWRNVAPMPTPRYGLAAATVNGKIYAFGGLQGAIWDTQTALAIVEEYNPATNTWRSRAPMPTARCTMVVAVVDGKIYAIGGYNGAPLAVVEEYDPAANTWRSRAPMPTTRWSLAGAAVNGRIYALGGYDNQIRHTWVEEYDPVANTWRSRTSMLTGRSDLAVAVVTGRLYAIGGQPEHDNPLTTVEEYNPVTDTWRNRASLLSARRHFGVAVSDGRIYAVGGRGENMSILETVEAYTPALLEATPGITTTTTSSPVTTPITTIVTITTTTPIMETTRITETISVTTTTPILTTTPVTEIILITTTTPIPIATHITENSVVPTIKRSPTPLQVIFGLILLISAGVGIWRWSKRRAPPTLQKSEEQPSPKPTDESMLKEHDLEAALTTLKQLAKAYDRVSWQTLMNEFQLRDDKDLQSLLFQVALLGELELKMDEMTKTVRLKVIEDLRGPKPKKIACPSCGAALELYEFHCPSCGEDFPPCIICRRPIQENLTKNPCCGTYAHTPHLQEWLRIRGTCPKCREPLQEWMVP